METSASAFRRPNGETYTPASMVEGMLSWVAEVCQPERVVDCDCGSGRFAAAAARAFPRAKVIVIDSSPLSALMCRAHARDITGEDEAYRRAELLPRLIVLPECIDELSAADARIAERIVWEGVEEDTASILTVLLSSIIRVPNSFILSIRSILLDCHYFTANLWDSQVQKSIYSCRLRFHIFRTRDP